MTKGRPKTNTKRITVKKSIADIAMILNTISSEKTLNKVLSLIKEEIDNIFKEGE